jgi:hypothetical protein
MSMDHLFKPVTSSSIQAVGYDEPSRTLHVRFNSGATYSYPDVEPEQHRALVEADSIGAHFSKHIRPHYTPRKGSEAIRASARQE